MGPLGFFAALINPTYGIIFLFYGWRVVYALAAFPCRLKIAASPAITEFPAYVIQRISSRRASFKTSSVLRRRGAKSPSMVPGALS